MFPAEEPFRRFRRELAKTTDKPQNMLSWSFSSQEFTVLPVFSDFFSQMEDVLSSLYALGVKSISAGIDYQLPQEDKVFAHLFYSLTCILGQESGNLKTDGTDKNLSGSAMEQKAAVLALKSRYLNQIGINSRQSSELLWVDLDIPVTDIAIEEEAESVDIVDLEQKIADRDMRIMLVDLFLSQVPGRIAEWHQAIDENNIVNAHRIMHSLKGSALNLSAHRLAGLARRLEMQLKINHTDEAEELGKRIDDELDTVCSFLRDYLNKNKD